MNKLMSDFSLLKTTIKQSYLDCFNLHYAAINTQFLEQHLDLCRITDIVC